jgi:hypothetical protein
MRPTGLPIREPRLPARMPLGVRDNLACSHRSFTWPVPRGIPPVGSYPTLSPITCDRQRSCDPSAGLLSVALDVTAGLRRAAPRVFSPSGLYYESGLCSANRSLGFGSQRRVGRPGSKANYTLRGQGRKLRVFGREPPRLMRTILVGVTRTSTLAVPSQRARQRGSSPTEGSNQIPRWPSASITPS